MRVQDIVSEITAGLRAAEIPSPRLEAELLCALALKTTRLAITVHGGREPQQRKRRRNAGGLPANADREFPWRTSRAAGNSMAVTF